MNTQQQAFVNMCVCIATQHPASKRVSFENDVCMKSGLTSFANSMEYRDSYLTISSAMDDNAVYVEYLQPVNKLVILIDGRGVVGTYDGDYMYLVGYVSTIYQGILKMINENMKKSVD